MKDPKEMTRKEFEDLEYYNGPHREVICHSIVLLPADDDEELHYSGYRVMRFIALGSRGETIGKFGDTDVVHIGGFEGLGCAQFRGSDKILELTRTAGWSIDCLAVSGLLRIFCNYPIIFRTDPLLSFDIYATEAEKEMKQ